MDLNTTLSQIMLVQPNNVTFGNYDITAIQENIITLIVDQLQDYVTNKTIFPTDLLAQPVITIICDEAGGLNNKAKVINEAKKLITKTFEFKWIAEKYDQIETTGTIITTIHDIKQTNKIKITWNPWAIPFFLYYGKGVGGTRFNKILALTLSGYYTKRLYKIICSQRSRKEYYYSIDQFRIDLNIPESYTNAKIKKRILEPSKIEINNSSSDVKFEYTMIAKRRVPGRKPSFDTIIFKIHNNVKKGNDYPEYNLVYRWITICTRNSNICGQEIVDHLLDKGYLQKIYDRLVYWEGKLMEGKMERLHIVNSLKKMLSEDYDISLSNKAQKSLF